MAFTRFKLRMCISWGKKEKNSDSFGLHWLIKSANSISLMCCKLQKSLFLILPCCFID